MTAKKLKLMGVGSFQGLMWTSENAGNSITTTKVLRESNTLRAWTGLTGNCVSEFLVCSWENRSNYRTSKSDFYNLDFRTEISLSRYLYLFF